MRVKVWFIGEKDVGKGLRGRCLGGGGGMRGVGWGFIRVWLNLKWGGGK